MLTEAGACIAEMARSMEAADQHASQRDEEGGNDDSQNAASPTAPTADLTSGVPETESYHALAWPPILERAAEVVTHAPARGWPGEALMAQVAGPEIQVNPALAQRFVELARSDRRFHVNADGRVFAVLETSRRPTIDVVSPPSTL